MSGIDAKVQKRYPKLNEVKRSIIWFDKVSEEFSDGVYVESIPLSVLQHIFDRQPGDPMVEAFDITEKEAKILSQYVEVDFDFTKYDYELDADYDYQRAGGWEGGAPFPTPSGK